MSDLNHYLKELDQLLQQQKADKLLAWFELVPEEYLSRVATRMAAYIQRMSVFHEHNQTDLNTVFKSIESFRPVTNFAVEWLVQLLLQHEEGLSSDNEHIAQACLMLLKVEYAMYGSMLVRARKNPDDWQAIGLCIHRLMFTQIYINVIRYMMYMAVPDKEWHNLHKLYILSAQYKLTDFTLTDDMHFIADRLSIANLYTFVLLLGCARLHQLPVKDILKACRCIISWVSMVSVSRHSHNHDNEIVVDVTSGSAPNFRRLFDHDQDAVFYYIHIEKLLENLEVKNTDEGSIYNRIKLTESLKNHLINAWSHYSEREERHVIDECVEATIGFRNIHYYLCGARELEGFLGDRAKLFIQFEEFEDIALMANEPDKNLWVHGLSDPRGHLVFGETPESYTFQRHFEPQAESRDDQGRKSAVKMIDRSLHGCCIEFDEPEALNIQADELIGFRNTHNHSHWQVGVVAWVRHIEDSVVHVGVRMLSTEAIPLGIDVPLDLGVSESYIAGILMPYEKRLGYNASILFVENYFHEQDVIKVSQRGLTKSLKLTRQVHSGENFIQIEFGYYVDDAESVPASSERDLDMNDIDLNVDVKIDR